VKDLNQRFALNRVVFVGDRGMMTVGNVEQLRQNQQGYLLGLQRRNRKDTFDYIQEAEARTDWQQCPVGIAAAEKAVVPQTRVVEVAGRQAGVRVLVVHSEEREVYERSMREQTMERARKELEALKAQVDKGQLKGADKIGAAAATRLRRHHGQRYFGWELRGGKFHFFEHPTNLAREKALEGKYVIQTEERNLSPLQAVAAYKELNEVERGFSHLKSLLELRPVYHHTDERVQAHVFVAALALLLDRALEKTLRAANSQLSTPFAWQALETVRSVQVELGQQRSKSCVTRGNKHASEVLRLLGITQLDPPVPPENQECLV
jgi:transposase